MLPFSAQSGVIMCTIQFFILPFSNSVQNPPWWSLWIYCRFLLFFHYVQTIRASLFLIFQEVVNWYYPLEHFKDHLFFPSSPYLDLFPSLKYKDPSVSLKCLVRQIFFLLCIWFQSFPSFTLLPCIFSMGQCHRLQSPLPYFLHQLLQFLPTLFS